MMFKGKIRADRHANKLYYKDWQSLISPNAKYRALAAALDEAEAEIEAMKNEFKMEEFKPCPICWKQVHGNSEKSTDGTITWVRISHGPTVSCGISFLADEKDAAEKWNARVK